MEVKLKSLSEAIGEKPFYPELEKVPFNTLIGSQIVIVDARIMRDFESHVTEIDEHGNEYQKKVIADLALLKIGNNGTSFRTAVSSGAVVKMIDKGIKARAFPCTAQVIEQKSEASGNTYFNLK